MYQDVESDFWKDIFVHMQHKNMVRVGAERLYVQDCQAAFDRFALIHPEIQPEITNAETYKTWEIFISDTIKLRLFIQNQIKGTLLQRNGGELVKIADAKFPNNPFPEIEEFLSKKDEYLRQLHKEIQVHTRDVKKQKLTGEFIKAHLIKKFFGRNDVIWSLEPAGNDFILKLKNQKEEKNITLSCENYIKLIEAL